MDSQMTRRELKRLKERMTALEGELAQLKADVARIETRLDVEEAAAVPPPPTKEGVSSQFSFEVGISVYEAERQLILKTLKELGGNKTKAANILGLTPRTIRNKLREYEQEEKRQVASEVTEYLNNYDQLRSPISDIAVPPPSVVVSDPLRQFRAWLRGEAQLPQLPIETFRVGLKWMLEQGEYDKILKLKGKIPEDMAIKGIFLVAKRHVDAALLE